MGSCQELKQEQQEAGWHRFELAILRLTSEVVKNVSAVSGIASQKSIVK
jgi:hypothetical protein